MSTKFLDLDGLTILVNNIKDTYASKVDAIYSLSKKINGTINGDSYSMSFIANNANDEVKSTVTFNLATEQEINQLFN